METETASSASISFADPETHRCPFPAYDRLRVESPVYQDPKTGSYVLTRYEDVRKALLNNKVLSNRTGLQSSRSEPAANEVYAKKGWVPVDTLVSNDLPGHRKFRSLVDRVFAPARVAALEPRVQDIIDELIDAFIDMDEIDFLDAFAVRLPMYVIAEQLGIAREHMAQFKLWSDVSVEMVNPTITREREIEIAEILVDMQHYVAKVIERVRAAPDGTLISLLVNTQVDERPLTMQELQSLIQQLLVAGNETTTTSLASGVKLMIEQPGIVDRLFAQPDSAHQFVEENLRVLSPIQTLMRRVLEDLEIGGVTIPKGAMVEVRFGAANRDPELFECPETIDFDRKNATNHLAFGSGIHLCIGNQLARAELRLAFRTLARRFSSMRFSRGEASCRWTTSYIAHGVDQMWISFDRRS